MKAIYKIQNTNTGDYYIGSAVDFTYRKWVHLKRLREGKHHNAILQNSWNKHGESAFLFEVIEEVLSKEELVPREQHFIDTLNPRYNICKIAGSPLGIKHSNEARLNMSIAHKKLTKEERNHKKDCKCALCYRKTGENSPRYIKREERFCKCECGGSFICMITSQKRFISGHNKAGLGKKRSLVAIETQREKVSKPVIQFTLYNTFIKDWPSAKEAGTTLNVSVSGIGAVCSSKRKTAGGFIWRFKQKTIC